MTEVIKRLSSSLLDEIAPMQSQCSDRRDQVGAVVLIEKLVLYVTYKKIGVAGSHFCAHSYTINLFVIVAGE